ncbi:MAG: hypothetical protein WAV20_18270 [Blastocatellia bacterium]
MKDEEESFSARISNIALAALSDVWLVWLTVAVLTTLPYAVALMRTPEGFVFSGVLTAYDDTFTYFTWIRQSADGHMFMCDLYTSEKQSCEFLLPLWNVLGLTSRLTRMPIALTFNVARLLAGLLLLLVARSVAGGVIKSRTRVRYALWLYAMSGGLGWLVYFLQNRIDLLGASPASGSADLNIPEAIAFRSVFGQVHFAVGAALLFGSIKLFFSALVGGKITRALYAGLLATLLAVVHPYLVIVAGAVVGVSLLAWPWFVPTSHPSRGDYNSRARAALAFALTMFPGAAYLFYLNRSNKVLREWLRATDTLSPPPWEYALGFGIVILLAIAGFSLMWRRHREPYGRLLLLWALVQAALLYAPVSFQRRLVEGIQLPLSIAASVALFWIARRFFKTRTQRRAFLISVVAFASVTNVGFVVGQMVPQGPASVSADPRRYVPNDLIAAFDWLRTNSEPDAVLFSSYLTGNIAPSATGLRVFLGHYGQTINSDEKGAEVTDFYTEALGERATRQLFAAHRVRFVIFGPFERAMFPGFAPPRCLRPAYRQGDVEIFEVVL